jgi:predicted deacylase
MTPDVEPAASFESVAFSGYEPGPRLLVLGAVHGNETCGTQAITRAIAACRDGRIIIRRGQVTFVPVTNDKAYRQGTREGDRNLNRELREYAVPECHEDRVANVLCPLLRAHDVVLDIHSFKSQGEPCVFVGPADNSGAIEPFARAGAEAALAMSLGPALLIEGWLTTWVKAEKERARLGVPGASLSKGVGTTEYMRRAGGYGVTIECGSHQDPRAVDVAYDAIVNALAHLRLTDDAPPVPAARRGIELVEAVMCLSDGDRLEKAWTLGEAAASGAVIARRADGSAVTAPRDGFVIFANPEAKRFADLYFFGVASDRFG